MFVIVTDKITRKCIDNVVSFIPKLQSIGTDDIAKWIEPQKAPDGTLRFSLDPKYNPIITSLIEAFYENNFVQPYDWPHWQADAERLIADPTRLANVSLETCTKLITLHVRGDRFCGGHFGAMVRTGHILAILRRLEKLAESWPAQTASPMREQPNESTLWEN